ncbi:hypothetical protein [Nocardia fluminea]|uniref:hypothetical protein n=1 Tax=Nocardia fluminea TaxID=134984 RepID=UPI000C70626C|nr:hypothetical protein [Nocardia fluminea]
MPWQCEIHLEGERALRSSRPRKNSNTNAQFAAIARQSHPRRITRDVGVRVVLWQRRKLREAQNREYHRRAQRGGTANSRARYGITTQAWSQLDHGQLLTDPTAVAIADVTERASPRSCCDGTSTSATS